MMEHFDEPITHGITVVDKSTGDILHLVGYYAPIKDEDYNYLFEELQTEGFEFLIGYDYTLRESTELEIQTMNKISSETPELTQLYETYRRRILN